MARRPFSFGKMIVYLCLILWAATTLFPFAWVVNNSFKVSGLVVSDSFRPATVKIYTYDKNGNVVRENVTTDEYGREMYDKYLTDENGRVLTEGEASKPALKNDSFFSGLMGGVPEGALTAEEAAQNGALVYDETSAPVMRAPTLVNYVNAFTNPNVNILGGYKNSLIVSGTVMICVMVLSTMMAFALTRYRFRGRALVESLIVAALMFPAFSTIVPVYRMLAGAGLFDTLPGVILVQIAANLAFACTVMTGYVKGLPIEMEEAAFMEGSGPFRVFFEILLPVSKPALATVSIFTFIWSYNDLFVQMVLLRSKAKMPVCAILREISSQYGTDFGLMAAAVTIVVIPVLILYVLLQKNIIKGLTAGAVKG